MKTHKIIEEISDYHNPQEVPGMTQQESWVRRFHDYLYEQLERYLGEGNDELYVVREAQLNE